jgi:excisionase family DNA binding protein
MMMTEAQQPVKLLLTVEEAAVALSVCRSVAYQLVLTKQISSIKIGRARRVPVLALERYICEQMAIGA